MKQSINLILSVVLGVRNRKFSEMVGTSEDDAVVLQRSNIASSSSGSWGSEGYSSSLLHPGQVINTHNHTHLHQHSLIWEILWLTNLPNMFLDWEETRIFRKEKSKHASTVRTCQLERLLLRFKPTTFSTNHQAFPSCSTAVLALSWNCSFESTLYP